MIQTFQDGKMIWVERNRISIPSEKVNLTPLPGFHITITWKVWGNNPNISSYSKHFKIKRYRVGHNRIAILSAESKPRPLPGFLVFLSAKISAVLYDFFCAFFVISVLQKKKIVIQCKNSRLPFCTVKTSVLPVLIV